MLNRYSLWKNLFIAFVVAMGFYYAAPNIYAPILHFRSVVLVARRALMKRY